MPTSGNQKAILTGVLPKNREVEDEKAGEKRALKLYAIF